MSFKQASIISAEFDETNNSALVEVEIEDTEAGKTIIKMVVGSKHFEGVTTKAERIAAIESAVDEALPTYHDQLINAYQKRNAPKTMVKLSSTKKYTKLKVK